MSRFKLDVTYNLRLNREMYNEARTIAKKKYGIAFSEYLRMLISKDLSEEEPIQLNYGQIEIENMKKDMNSNFSKIFALLTKTKTGSTENLSDKIREFLNVFNSDHSYKRFNSSEISNYMNVSEQLVLNVLDSLIEQGEVKLYFNGKYGRVK